MDNQDKIVEDVENTSNTGGWFQSKPKSVFHPPEVTRHTGQSIALIMYNKRSNCASKFRSTIVRNCGVMKAYGKGEFLGQAIEESIFVQEGDWSADQGFGILSFDNKDDAERFLEADTEIRNWLWMGGVEAYILPGACPMKLFNNYPICGLEIYDVKDGACFAYLVNKITALAAKYEGIISVGTEQIKFMRGQRQPGFIVVSQWRNLGTFQQYAKEVSSLNKGGSGTIVAAEMEPFNF